MEGTRKYRKFDKEFKLEAVRLITEAGRPVAEVARSLDIHENLLRRWKNQYSEDPVASFPGKGHLKPQDEELKRLERENARLKEERDILKKVVAIFSKHRE
ncbi:transposase [bacterium]|nr:MAG: transposase [bacterium]